MHTLYWSKGTACLAPQIVLEELGLAYELVVVPTALGGHRTPEFLALNPAGKVPALRMPDETTMTEAAAICLHLADVQKNTDLSPAVEDPLRGQFLRHLFYLSTTLQEAYKRFYYPHRFSTETEASDGIKLRAVDELLEWWQIVERHLSINGPFLLGERFSLLDIYVTMLATWFQPREMLFDACPNVRTCFERVSQRRAVSKCLEMQGDELSIGTD